jgi:hypothetical protein
LGCNIRRRTAPMSAPSAASFVCCRTSPGVPRPAMGRTGPGLGTVKAADVGDDCAAVGDVRDGRRRNCGIVYHADGILYHKLCQSDSRRDILHRTGVFGSCTVLHFTVEVSEDRLSCINSAKEGFIPDFHIQHTTATQLSRLDTFTRRPPFACNRTRGSRAITLSVQIHFAPQPRP